MTVKIEKGKPFTLPDGTVVGNTGKVSSVEEQLAHAEIDAITDDPYESGTIETYNRTLADLPDDVKQMNPVMLVLAYTMWGLENHAISRYLSITPEQLQSIQTSDAFVQKRKELLEAIRYAESGTIHGYLINKARNAAEVIASQLNSKSADIQFAAAKDILDRSGFRPVDRTEHVHKFEDELRIVHLTDNKPPAIDVGI